MRIDWVGATCMVAAFVTLSSNSVAGTSKFLPLKNQPPSNYGACNPLLLTDGTVLVQHCQLTDWWRLKPDINGSYVNGTWTPVAPIPDSFGYSPIYESSAVLPDGRVVIAAGDFLLTEPITYSMGALYDPVTDEWTSFNLPENWIPIFSESQGQQSTILADGTFMVSNPNSIQSALFNAKTLAWTILPDTSKLDVNYEEPWTLLRGGDVLTVDFSAGLSNPQTRSSEVFKWRNGTWSRAGNTIVQLWSGYSNSCVSYTSYATGPLILRPDGTAFAAGASACESGHTATFDTHSGKWSAGPDFPDSLSAAFAPAAVLPDGNVLVGAGSAAQITQVAFVEFDGTHLTLEPAPDGAFLNSPMDVNLMVLPTGQILAVDNTADLPGVGNPATPAVEVYTSDAPYNPAWAPVITEAPDSVVRGDSYKISGYHFNGFTQGSANISTYQAATNYPLVRIKNKATGHVFYARTHDHSTMAVASDDLAWTTFDVSSETEPGASDLVVVANGIPSKAVSVAVK